MKIVKENINEEGDLNSDIKYVKEVENNFLFPDYLFYRHYEKNKDLISTGEFQFVQKFIKNHTERNTQNLNLHFGSFYKVKYGFKLVQKKRISHTL